MSEPSWKAELEHRGLEPGQPLIVSIPIDASPAAVWEKISEAGNLKHCHPFCASTSVKKWPGVGSSDSITYYSGICYQRDVVAWRHGVGYDMEVGSIAKKTCWVSWRIETRPEQRSEFFITVIPYLEKQWDEHERSRYLARFFGMHFDHYLQCVVKGVEYLVTTGNDVRENQFGVNPVFSAVG